MIPAEGFDFDRFPSTLAREAPDAVIYADGHGIIRFWNAGAERIFRFSEAEARRMDVSSPLNFSV